MAAVRFEGVKKSYGSVPIIHGFDMTIEDGEFVVIVGPSGCGKSTLLRMIAGLEEISEGTIKIEDRVVNQVEPQDRDIAMVFQNYALYPHMSVYENMSYGLRLRRTSSAKIAERIEQVADILMLKDLLKRKPRELSGGQRQRVAMGRAILREPKVFLFDEPLSNLDAKLRLQMRLEIKKLHQKLGITSVFVTHDQIEAMTLADRLVVMNAGRAEQIGTPREIYDHPATAYVGSFIGSPPMNMFEGIFDFDRASVEISGMPRFLLNGLAAARAGASGKITVGIRPEHLVPCDAGPDSFELVVDAVEELGADALIHARVADASLVIRYPGHARFRPGDMFKMSVDAAHIHLFPPS